MDDAISNTHISIIHTEPAPFVPTKFSRFHAFINLSFSLPLPFPLFLLFSFSRAAFSHNVMAAYPAPSAHVRRTSNRADIASRRNKGKCKIERRGALLLQCLPFAASHQRQYDGRGKLFPRGFAAYTPRAGKRDPLASSTTRRGIENKIELCIVLLAHTMRRVVCCRTKADMRGKEQG